MNIIIIVTYSLFYSFIHPTKQAKHCLFVQKKIEVEVVALFFGLLDNNHHYLSLNNLVSFSNYLLISRIISNNEWEQTIFAPVA